MYILYNSFIVDGLLIIGSGIPGFLTSTLSNDNKFVVQIRKDPAKVNSLTTVTKLTMNKKLYSRCRQYMEVLNNLHYLYLIILDCYLLLLMKPQIKHALHRMSTVSFGEQEREYLK